MELPGLAGVRIKIVSYSKQGGPPRRWFPRGRGSGPSWRPYYYRGRGGRTFKPNYSISRKAYAIANEANVFEEDSDADDDGKKSHNVGRSPCKRSKVGPYYGWNLYLADSKYEPDGPDEKKIKLLESFCKKWRANHWDVDVEEQAWFLVNAKEMEDDENIQKEWPTVLNDLKEDPKRIIRYLGLAMHQVLSMEIVKELEDDVAESEMPIDDLPKIRARIVNGVPVTPLKNLRADCFNKFVAVEGTVIRVSSIKPLCTKMAFECRNCEQVQIVQQPYGQYAIPAKCVLRGCRSRSFKPLRNSLYTETSDWQTIRLQETIQESQTEGGKVPRMIECELMHDLVDSCVPGEVVTVAGTVKNTSRAEGYSRNGKCMFLLYILANSVTVTKHEAVSSAMVKNSNDLTFLAGHDFSYNDTYKIGAMYQQGNVLEQFAASLCPSIYGHELVKAALVLGLVGGTAKYLGNCNDIPVRGDPHILIVGDPGLGKSQMLKACASVAPRGVYICGNTTTVSGLTVTLVKDGQGGGDYSLEAGALVLGDQGCCCIDEFDKMGNQQHALLEAMEQQTISIAKAGMLGSFPARTSILAAGNPVGGHYNRSKTVSENLKIRGALLSRFDLVFILLDRPDKDLDRKLSEHVTAMLASKSQSQDGVTPLSAFSFASTSQNEQGSLAEKLKFQAGPQWTPVSHEILRKYIAYARKYVHPKLSAEAKMAIQSFYCELRKRHQSVDGTPITLRQLESLVRLTEARARIELREEATGQDAEDVIEIMKHSMADVYTNEEGTLEFRRSQNGSGSSRSKAKRLISALTTQAQATNSSMFTVEQMKETAVAMDIKLSDFASLIDSLNNHGFLIKKGQKLYKLVTMDF